MVKFRRTYSTKSTDLRLANNGYLVPSDAPGFGIEVDLPWLKGVAV